MVLAGVRTAVMVRVLKAWFERPFEHFDAIEDLGSESSNEDAA